LPRLGDRERDTRNSHERHDENPRHGEPATAYPAGPPQYQFTEFPRWFSGLYRQDPQAIGQFRLASGH
jgi:hypothetical protein